MADHGSDGFGVVLGFGCLFRFCGIAFRLSRFLRFVRRVRFGGIALRLGCLIRCIRLGSVLPLITGVRRLGLAIRCCDVFLRRLGIVLTVGYILIRCGSVFFINLILCRVAGSLVFRRSRIFIGLIGLIGICVFFICGGRSRFVYILLRLIRDDVYFLIPECGLVAADRNALGLLHFLFAVNGTGNVGRAANRSVPVVDIQEQDLLVAGHHVHIVGVFRKANKDSQLRINVPPPVKFRVRFV